MGAGAAHLSKHSGIMLRGLVISSLLMGASEFQD
jgi:hypothetical protein